MYKLNDIRRCLSNLISTLSSIGLEKCLEKSKLESISLNQNQLYKIHQTVDQ